MVYERYDVESKGRIIYLGDEEGHEVAIDTTGMTPDELERAKQAAVRMLNGETLNRRGRRALAAHKRGLH